MSRAIGSAATSGEKRLAVPLQSKSFPEEKSQVGKVHYDQRAKDEDVSNDEIRDRHVQVCAPLC